MTTVYYWRIKCETDNKYEYIWAEETPDKCPTNTAHTINTGTIASIDKREPNLMEIKEESVSTGGHFQCITKTINTDASSTSTSNYTWPHPISVLAVYLVTTSVHEGDVVDLTVAPDTTIGVLTADASIGATTLTVSQTVIDNTAVGFWLKLNDGVNQDDLGRVLSVDVVAKTITVENALTHNFATATPSYLIQTVYMMKDYEIGPPWEYVVGESKIGGSYVPANTNIRVVYTNNGLVSKKLVAKIEFLY